MLTSPMNVSVFSNLQKQFQLAREKRIVIGEIEAEQRKRFRKRSAPHNHFGASACEKIDGCELLKYAHRVIRAQNGDGRILSVLTAAAAKIVSGAESRNSAR